MSSTALAQPADAPALRASLTHCREVTKREAGNFYYGLRLTPEPKRSALYTIYSWMRAADDIADEPGLPEDKLRRLDDFWAVTTAVLDGDDPRDDDLWPALRHTVESFGIPRDELASMIDGLRADARLDAAAGADPAFDSFAELDDYCYRVASIVGIVCVRIWGLRDGADWDRARELAERRGRAFQLTNILRDIAGDFERGRVYIPREHLDAHRLSAGDLAAWDDPARCHACVGDLIARARSRYDGSAPLDDMVHADGAGALWAMTQIYRGLLERIADDPAAIGRRRVSLPTVSKVIIGARALARSRGRRG